MSISSAHYQSQPLQWRLVDVAASHAVPPARTYASLVRQQQQHRDRQSCDVATRRRIRPLVWPHLAVALSLSLPQISYGSNLYLFGEWGALQLMRIAQRPPLSKLLLRVVSLTREGQMPILCVHSGRGLIATMSPGTDSSSSGSSSGCVLADWLFGAFRGLGAVGRVPSFGAVNAESAALDASHSLRLCTVSAFLLLHN